MPAPDVDDVLTALELISARVPDRHVTPDIPMAAAWLPELARFDKAVVFAAARSWGTLRFPSASEFFEACQAESRHVALERASTATPAGPCDRCENGFIEVDATGQGTYEPCPNCRPVERAMWEHRTDPNHPERCSDCAKIRKGGKDLPPWLVAARERAATGEAPMPTF